MTMLPMSLRKELEAAAKMEAAAKSQRAPTSAQYRSEQPVKFVLAAVLNVVAVVMLAGVL